MSGDVQVRGLDHVVFLVSDVEASIEWYRSLLGVEVERLEEWRRGEAPFVSLRIDATTIIDLFASPEAPGTGINHVAIVIDGDLDEIAGRPGLDVEGPPADLWGAQGYGRGVYVRDPDGNLVELRVYAA